jgi:hypothetical protein
MHYREPPCGQIGQFGFAPIGAFRGLGVGNPDILCRAFAMPPLASPLLNQYRHAVLRPLIQEIWHCDPV